MFTRLLIRLRWIMSAITALVIAAMLASLRYSPTFEFFNPVVSVRNVVSLGNGALVIAWLPGCDESTPPSRLPLYLVSRHEPNEVVWWTETYALGKYGQVWIPLWAVALLPSFIAIAGFAAKRVQPTPGFCKQCRYPLKGATKCPESGRAAPSN